MFSQEDLDNVLALLTDGHRCKDWHRWQDMNQILVDCKLIKLQCRTFSQQLQVECQTDRISSRNMNA
jgi:hypothetical protein